MNAGSTFQNEELLLGDPVGVPMAMTAEEYAVAN